MKKLLLFTFTLMLVYGSCMAQEIRKSPALSDGGEFSGISALAGPQSTLQSDQMNVWALPSTGSTSGNARIPRNTLNRYQREEYLITAAEMAASGFPSGNTIDEIGFLIATAGVGSQAGTLNIYLRNTTDATYTLGTSWTTTDFTQVSTDANWTIPVALGAYNIPFVGGTPFAYTGGGVYVAWEFSNPSGTIDGTTSLVASCNTTQATMCYGYQNASAQGTALTVTAYRPATQFTNNTLVDIVNITNIYALEKAPIGYSASTPVNVRVANVSSSVSSFDVILTVKDPTNTTTRFTSTQTVTALAANSAIILTFTGWNPAIQENVNITATTSVIPAETWAGNNVKNIQSNVNDAVFGYNYSTAGPSGFGFTYSATGGAGLFAAKFIMNGTGIVNGANLVISGDVANTGNTIYAVVMNSAGVILSQSPNYVIAAGDLGINKAFSFPAPPSFTNELFYIGLAQTQGTAQWYPMGSFSETPQRDNTFYTGAITGGALTVLPITFNLKFGIEAKVGAILPAVYAVTGSGSYCTGGSGLPVGLAGSESGVTYTLYKDAAAQVPTVAGTGSAITFGSQLSGTYTVEGTNAGGTIAMTGSAVIAVNSTPAPVISEVGSTLVSDAPDGNQWYLNGVIIDGATASTYEILVGGTYYVIVTINGCSSEPSNSLIISHEAIVNAKAGQVEIFPVPSNGLFTATIASPSSELFTIRAYNSIGSLVFEKKDVAVNGTARQTIDMRNQPSGVYTVIFSTGGNQFMRKMMINQ